MLRYFTKKMTFYEKRTEFLTDYYFGGMESETPLVCDID